MKGEMGKGIPTFEKLSPEDRADLERRAWSEAGRWQAVATANAKVLEDYIEAGSQLREKWVASEAAKDRHIEALSKRVAELTELLDARAGAQV